MKKFFLKNIAAVFAAASLILGLVPSAGFAQANPGTSAGSGSSVHGSLSDVKGFDQSIFDYHFSRADRELNPDRWISEARRGIGLALNAWEFFASGLYDNPLLLEGAKKQIEEWSAAELEERFTRWLTGRFFGEAAAKAASRLSSLLGETGPGYIYHLDPEGNILYDPQSGDPLVIRPGEEGREFPADLVSWRNAAGQDIQAAAGFFDAAIARLNPELLAYIPEEMRESLGAKIAGAVSAFSGSARTEFENIAAREERIFTARRTGDVWSLRKKSDDEAARAITARLIEEVEDTCARGIAGLASRIEAASAGSGDLALMGKEWLEMYREQFDRGLKAWEQAEERFFVRRVEWEQEAGMLFAGGEESWAGAFGQFQEEQKKWELKTKELFESGEALFKNASANLEKSIADAKSEFAYNLRLRTEAGTAKAKALVDMYLTGGSGAAAARENILFWLKQYGGGNKTDPADPAFGEWLAGEIKKQGSMNKNSINLLEEIKKSFDLYNSCLGKVKEAREKLVADYNGLSGSGALKDILSDNVSSEDFSLDEYQVALIKSKALVQYWERRTAIAEAVSAYAKDVTAGRMTGAEGLRAWESARTAYSAALAEYEKELQKLNAAGASLREKQAVLETLALEMSEAEEALNALNLEYSAIIAANAVNREDYMLAEFNVKYTELLAKYRQLMRSGDSAVYKPYLEYALELGIAEQRGTAESLRYALINGDGEEMRSLAELREAAAAARSPLEKSEAETALRVRVGGIDLLNAETGADWYCGVRNLSMTESEKAELAGRKLAERLSADSENSFRALLAKRIALETAALDCFLNGSSGKTGDAVLLSQSCLVDRAAAEKGIAALRILAERLAQGGDYTGGGGENAEITGWFAGGGSFFGGSENFLIEELAEYRFSRELLELYETYGGASAFAAKESWRDTGHDLAALFAAYGIDPGTRTLPDVRDICAAITDMPGDFAYNTARFLMEFDRCFAALPEWLGSEINGWKNAFAEYAALNALYRGKTPGTDMAALALEQEAIESRYRALEQYYNSLVYTDDETVREIKRVYAELNTEEIFLSYRIFITGTWERNNLEASGAEKNKDRHWRQYLGGEYVNGQDNSINGAASWKEGALLDALDSADLGAWRVNDALALYMSHDEKQAIRETGFLIENLEIEDEKTRRYLNTIALLREELVRLGQGYEYTKLPPDIFKKELEKLYTALKDRESAFDNVKDRYLREAEGFAQAGELYDRQYTRLKNACEIMEEKRFGLDIQDAIRRWASTAYLEAETGELDTCKDSLEKARTVLAVLSDLYTNEERRPYDNPEYQAVYSNYEQSFNKALVSLKSLNELKKAIAAETLNNEKMFDSYQAYLDMMGSVPGYGEGYTSPSSRSAWGIKDIITLRNGRLAFSTDGSMRLDGLDAGETETLRGYFDLNKIIPGQRHETSDFETAVRELGARMEYYFSQPKKFTEWGRARDYLVRTLTESNGDLGFLRSAYLKADALAKGGSLARTPYKTGVFTAIQYLGDYSGKRQNHFRRLQQQAWNNLSDTERADLEFYVILTLSGNANNYIYGFSQYTALDEYKDAYYEVEKFYDRADDRIKKIPLIGLAWLEMRDINKSALKRVKASRDQTKNYTLEWERGLSANISRIRDFASAYAGSCARLDVLEGKAASGQGIGWDDINRALTAAGIQKDLDMTVLKTCWEEMIQNAGGTFADVSEGLTQLALWTGSERNKAKKALDNRWRLDEQNLREKETDFFETAAAFFDGKMSAGALSAAAEAAYGEDAAAWKNHYGNIEKTLLMDLAYFPAYGSDYISNFSELGNDYISLVTGVFTRRYNMELTARNAEWDEQRRDLAEKYQAWQETAALIIEKGRADWKTGARRMEASYKTWKENFLEEHERISAAWTDAYLTGLEEKEQWLNRAAAAADQASSEAFLGILGAEAERLARVMDTREPAGIRNAAPEAERLLAELLNTPGLGNIVNTLGTLTGTAGPGGGAVKRGMGGAGVWDAGVIKAAAADMSRETNAELAAQESRRLAFNARAAALEALKSIAANVDSANNDFRESMDRMYIVQGQWRKSGGRYIKDIIAGSTVFEPVITDEQRVEAYKDYRMEPVELKTNLDEQYLAGLNSLAVRGLIENVYLEIEVIMAEIFGNGERREIRTGKGKDEQLRYLGSGKFGGHIGYEPAMRPSGGSGDSRDALFYDRGSGELGRLMTEFYYWSIIDSRGAAELSMAFWDKRLWDDRDSWISAPSIRSAADIGLSIVLAAAALPTGGASLGALALMGLANSADDLVFAGLDAAFGYKTIDEAGFAIGKAALINTAGSFIPGVFGDAGKLGEIAVNTAKGVGGGIGTVAAQTVIAGAQTITTGLATSAISGITYSHEAGLGYSREVFMESLRGTITSTWSSTGSALVTGTLGAINSGIDLEKLTGFSALNKENVATLNKTAGALAGQGIQYAAGGDFTLNLLNTSLLSREKSGSGLLELHLGRDGSPRMNLGSGGANVSPDTIAGALQGIRVWDVNNRIDQYARSHDFKAMVALRAQYGFGEADQRTQLWEILAGAGEIQVGKEGDFRAETTRSADGKRVVTINGYYGGMSEAEQMRLGVVLGHEAYRDGIVTGDNNLETRAAVFGHTGMAISMILDGQRLGYDNDLAKDIAAYFEAQGNRDVFNAYVDGAYDSSADYWKLTRDGKLEYDGFATLRDEKGDIIRSFRDMDLKSDNPVEGALLYLMGVNKKDTAKVAAVRAMMEGAGLQHSFNIDPNQWNWKGEHKAVTGNRGSFPAMGTVDLTAANMGKSISIEAIANSFGAIGATGDDIIRSIDRIYVSSIGFLNYAEAGGKLDIANTLLSKYYSKPQLEMVQVDRNYQNGVLKKKQDIRASMYNGKVEQTQAFNVTSYYLDIHNDKYPEAPYYLTENHPAIDYGANGTTVNTPGGFWTYKGINGYNVMFQLYGGDLRMRINHVDTASINKAFTEKQVVGNSEGPAFLFDYPKEKYGTGTGAHTHTEFTRFLPYKGVYTRQFVNPNTLLPAAGRLEYGLYYYDQNKKLLEQRTFNRNF